MKKIIFSFDDGRLDTYTRAIPILQTYEMKATINIVTDFVENTSKYDIFPSAGNRAMTKEMVLEVYKKGYEIASHGHTHHNNADDIIKSLDRLSTWGIPIKEIGFASPFSYLTINNCPDIITLKTNNILQYLRSGIQIRREGFLFSLLSVLADLIRSKRLFYLINKKNIINEKKLPEIIIGISVTSNTTPEQIMYTVNKMKDGEIAVFIMHSVLSENDSGIGNDKWYMREADFKKICAELHKCSEVWVTTMKQALGV